MYKVLDLRTGEYKKDWTTKYDLCFSTKKSAEKQILHIVGIYNLYEASPSAPWCIPEYFEAIEVPDV